MVSAEGVYNTHMSDRAYHESSVASRVVTSNSNARPVAYAPPPLPPYVVQIHSPYHNNNNARPNRSSFGAVKIIYGITLIAGSIVIVSEILKDESKNRSGEESFAAYLDTSALSVSTLFSLLKIFSGGLPSSSRCAKIIKYTDKFFSVGSLGAGGWHCILTSFATNPMLATTIGACNSVRSLYPSALTAISSRVTSCVGNCFRRVFR